MAALHRIIITLAICTLFAIIAVAAQEDRDNGDVEEPVITISSEEENEQHHEEERPMTITFVNEMSNEIIELFWEVGTIISSNSCYMIIYVCSSITLVILLSLTLFISIIRIQMLYIPIQQLKVRVVIRVREEVKGGTHRVQSSHVVGV